MLRFSDISMSQIIVKSLSDLPNPALTKFCQLDSEGSAHKVQELKHVFKLPNIGEYMYDFKLFSNVLLLNQTLENPHSNFYDNISCAKRYGVDCILNYISSISLAIDQEDRILCQIDDVQTINEVTHQNLSSILGINMDFLRGLPIISGALWASDIYIVVRFKKQPPMKYYLSFETGFISDQAVLKQIRESQIVIQGSINYNLGLTQPYNLVYFGGKLY